MARSQSIVLSESFTGAENGQVPEAMGSQFGGILPFFITCDGAPIEISRDSGNLQYFQKGGVPHHDSMVGR